MCGDHKHARGVAEASDELAQRDGAALLSGNAARDGRARGQHDRGRDSASSDEHASGRYTLEPTTGTGGVRDPSAPDPPPRSPAPPGPALADRKSVVQGK